MARSSASLEYYEAHVRTWAAFHCLGGDDLDPRFTEDLTDEEYYARENDAKAAGKALGDSMAEAAEPFGPLLISRGRLLQPQGCGLIPFTTPDLAAFRDGRMFTIYPDDSLVFDPVRTAQHMEFMAAQDQRMRATIEAQRQMREEPLTDDSGDDDPPPF